MAQANRNGLDNFHAHCHVLDVTTSGAGLAYAAFVSPVRGRLIRYKAVCYGTVSGTASTVTVKINSTTVSGITGIAFVSGVAAGACYSDDTKWGPLVQQGDVVSFTSDAAGANETQPVTYQATIRKV